MEGVVWRLVSTWVFFQIGECRFVAEANKNRDIKILKYFYSQQPVIVTFFLHPYLVYSVYGVYV